MDQAPRNANGSSPITTKPPGKGGCLKPTKPPSKKKSPEQIARIKRRGGKVAAANQENKPMQPVPKRYTPYVDGYSRQ